MECEWWKEWRIVKRIEGCSERSPSSAWRHGRGGRSEGRGIGDKVEGRGV